MRGNRRQPLRRSAEDSSANPKRQILVEHTDDSLKYKQLHRVFEEWGKPEAGS